MTLRIAAESPLSAEGRTLIAGSEAALREVYSMDECFSFTAEELDRPDIRFLVARDPAGAALGCVALCDCGDYAEIKRLYVPAEGRGRGTARALMAALEGAAFRSGKSHVRLETGEKLESAVALYEKLGYSRRGRFGSYEDHPSSLFMEKRLT